MGLVPPRKQTEAPPKAPELGTSEFPLRPPEPTEAEIWNRDTYLEVFYGRRPLVVRGDTWPRRRPAWWGRR